LVVVVLRSKNLHLHLHRRLPAENVGILANLLALVVAAGQQRVKGRKLAAPAKLLSVPLARQFLASRQHQAPKAKPIFSTPEVSYVSSPD
jgi:hypothetical protein